MNSQTWKKGISLLLGILMLLSYIPSPVFAEGGEGFCEHHSAHTEECGYVEGECECSFLCSLCQTPAEEPAEESPEEPVEEPAEESEEAPVEESAGVPSEEEALLEEMPVVEYVNPETDLPDNDELFALYAEQKLYGYEMTTFGTAARAKLNAAEQGFYDALKAQIEMVATNGGSTEFALENISNLKTTWTWSELGMTSLDWNTIYSAFKSQFDLNKVMKALLADCPFDLYWYDKTSSGGASMGYSGWSRGAECGVKNITFRFYVSVNYQGGETYVTTDVARVTAARKEAMRVVAANAGKTDYERLVAYKEYICSAVAYNHYAADNDVAYGDPWQLINVFDGDTATDVVCEGYAKAFQYLCDLDGALSCISVSGQMIGATGSGGHMWNVVTLNGKNYLVDVTNSDTGTVGNPDKLFLVGAPYSDGSYAFACGYSTVYFVCDDLSLATEKYSSYAASVTIDGVTTNCATLADAVNITKSSQNAGKQATIKLLQSIDLGRHYQVLNAGIIILDLNGKTLTSTNDKYGTLYVTGCDLTITDTAGGGAIRCEDRYAVNLYGSSVSAAKVTVEKGTLYGKAAGLHVQRGYAYINGGTVSGYNYGLYPFTVNAFVTITGGTITGSRGIYTNGGEVTMTGGTVTGRDEGAHINGGSLRMSGGTICEATQAITVSYGAATLTGGTVSGTGYDIVLNNEYSNNNSRAYLNLGADGKTGTTFPGGITLWNIPAAGYKEISLPDLPGTGAAYWQGSTMCDPESGDTEITGGDVVIRAECSHSFDKTTHLCACGVADPAYKLRGDLDLNKLVNSEDLTLLARHVGGIELLPAGVARLNGDVNRDGVINSEDLTLHARYVGGIITDWNQE